MKRKVSQRPEIYIRSEMKCIFAYIEVCYHDNFQAHVKQSKCVLTCFYPDSKFSCKDVSFILLICCITYLFIIFSHLLTFQGIRFQGLIGEGILPPQGIMRREARPAARQLTDLRVESHGREKNGKDNVC